VDVTSANPQDTTWLTELPLYRVYFWRGSSSYEYELRGCHNVREAIAWAEENAGAERSFTLYAVVDRGNERGLVRLFGIDPTRNPGPRKPDWPGEVYLD